MKKHEQYIGKVEKILFPNKGVVRVAGEEKSVIVKNVIPGEEIKFVLTKNRKDKCEGRFMELIKPSPLSTEPICKHYRKCGGCLYSGISYDKQCQIKKEQVLELLGKYINLDTFEGIIPSPNPYEYRNKMEFSFGDEIKGGKLSLGMHKRDAHYDIVSVTDCKIVDEDFRTILKTTLDFMTNRKISFYHINTHVGFLRNLIIRKGQNTDEIMVNVITSSQGIRAGIANDILNESDNNIDANKTVSNEIYQLLNDYKKEILALNLKGDIVSIIHTTNNSLSDAVINEGIDILYGKDYFNERLWNLNFRVSPFSFFQTNTKGAELLYDKVNEYIGEISKNVVYDLYSGTGTITQMVSQVAKQAIGVEIVEEAVESAILNSKNNGLNNCQYIAGDVLEVLDELSDENSVYPRPDIIILDPPRDGIHPKALPKIINFGVNKIIYVSCKPTSLARDLEVFIANGYKVTKSCLVDMFPWTGNVETVILLSKN